MIELLIICLIVAIVGFGFFYTRMMNDTYLNGVPEYKEEMMREVRKMKRLLKQLPDKGVPEYAKLEEMTAELEILYSVQDEKSPDQRKEVYRLIEANQHLASAQQDEKVVQQAFLQQAIDALRPLLSS